MDDQEAIKIALKRSRINNIIIAVCLLLAIGFFFYGIVNSIQAKMQKELSVKARIELEECKKNTEYAIRVAEGKTQELNEKERQLTKALQEARLFKEEVKR